MPVPVPAIHAVRPAAACPQPVWPREALRYELEGTATISFKALPDGQLSDVALTRSTGWELLDNATLALAPHCRLTAQQVAAAGDQVQTVEYVWSLSSEQQSVYPRLVPDSCAVPDKFARFVMLDRQPSDVKGVKLRFLIDKNGAPHGVKLERANLDPAMAAQLVGYVESCRFAFEPGIPQGVVRNDSIFGRVVFR